MQTVLASQDQGISQTIHNMEMACQFAQGYWFGDRASVKYVTRFTSLFEPGLLDKRLNPPRAYNWLMRNTSRFIYMLDPTAPTPLALRASVVANQKAEGERQKAEGMQLEAKPNPFNPHTIITFQVDDYALKPVNLSIYNASGKLLATLVNQSLNHGTHRVQWQAGNRGSGLYFARLQVGSKTAMKRLLLVK
jgi:hypothetical protein